MGCVRKFTDEYLIVIGQGNLVQGAGKPNPYRWHLGALELGSAVPALPNLLVVKCQQNLVHCQTIFAIFMLLCYHWIPIYLLVQIQLTLMEWSIQCVSKNIK